MRHELRPRLLQAAEARAAGDRRRVAEAVVPGVAEGDLFEERALPGGAVVGCATLESVRAAKVASGREKDARDVAEIDRIGYDPARYARVAAAYRAMRIECVAHGE